MDGRAADHIYDPVSGDIFRLTAHGIPPEGHVHISHSPGGRSLADAGTQDARLPCS